jgi:predicted RNase H-like nuclease (RuvC/YqgF family)
VQIDRESPPGAWQREWDARSHTETEYRQEIREMRERIQYYVRRIDELETEVKQLRAQDARWVQEP